VKGMEGGLDRRSIGKGGFAGLWLGKKTEANDEKNREDLSPKKKQNEQDKIKHQIKERKGWGGPMSWGLSNLKGRKKKVNEINSLLKKGRDRTVQRGKGA